LHLEALAKIKKWLAGFRSSSHCERLVVTVIIRIALREARDLGSKVLAE
jgi:hypothetical protein